MPFSPAFETCSSVQIRHCWDGACLSRKMNGASWWLRETARTASLRVPVWAVIAAFGRPRICQICQIEFCGENQKVSGKEPIPISRPAPMRGGAAEAAAMLLLPTCVLALIGEFVATMRIADELVGFIRNGTAAMQRNSSYHSSEACHVPVEGTSEYHRDKVL